MKLSKVVCGLIAVVAVVVVPAIGSANVDLIDIVHDDDGTSAQVRSSDLPAYWDALNRDPDTGKLNDQTNTYRCELSNGQVWWFLDNANGHKQCRAMHEEVGPPRAGEVTYETEMHAGSEGDHGGFLIAMQFENEPDAEHQRLIDAVDLSYSSRPLQMFVGYGVSEATEDGVLQAFRASCVKLVRNAQPPVARYNRHRAIEACLDRVVVFSANDDDTGRCAAVIRHDSAHGFLRLSPVFTHEQFYRGSRYYRSYEPLVYAFGPTETEAEEAARETCSGLAGGAGYCQDTVLKVCNNPT